MDKKTFAENIISRPNLVRGALNGLRVVESLVSPDLDPAFGGVEVLVERWENLADLVGRASNEPDEKRAKDLKAEATKMAVSALEATAALYRRAAAYYERGVPARRRPSRRIDRGAYRDGVPAFGALKSTLTVLFGVKFVQKVRDELSGASQRAFRPAPGTVVISEAVLAELREVAKAAPRSKYAARVKEILGQIS